MDLDEEEMATAKSVARRIGYRWTRVDKEDIEQHLMLWLLQNHQHLVRWRKEPGNGKLYVSLRREASKFCAKETSAANHAELDSYLPYTSKTVARVLPYIWQLDTMTQPGSDAVAIVMDISSGYYGLKKADQEVLALRYRDDLTHAEIGQLLGVSEDAVRKRLNRTIDRLANSLVGETVHWRSQTAKKRSEYDDDLVQGGYGINHEKAD
jgi:RNA polymerase sigma factor (sigma-70 family)